MTPSLPQPAPADDEIDLSQLAASLRRRWPLIAWAAGGTLLLSGVITLLQKPVWEGEFQIVLANSEGSGGSRLAQLAAANPMLAGLAGLGGGGGKDSLETEVKVLESPSVLKPVFDFVKSSKLRAGDNVDRLRYADWAKDNLEIKLEKGTSVLNIAYRDSDQALILPVIQRISKAYQDYSGRDRRRDIANAVTYLQGRITDLAPKAEASMRQAQAFALANGLGLQDGLPAASSEMAGGGAGSSGSGGSVEATRMAAQGQVIALRQQLTNAKAAGSAVLFQAPQLEANQELYKRYQDVEAGLAEKRSRLREGDPIIRALLREKAALASTLNRETIALLQGQLATAEARLQSASRPKEVVLQHRQLVRQALREEKTLAELENQLQLASLEQAKQTEPWELISTPTLLDRPVSPRKGRNLALGLLAGLVLGSGAALVAERRSGRVFAIDELQAALPGPLLARLDLAAPESWAATLALLASGPLAGASTVALIPVAGQGEPELAQALQQALQQLTPGAQVLGTSDLVAAGTCQAQLLVARPGAITRQQLDALRQQLQLQGRPALGWLLLQSTDA